MSSVTTTPSAIALSTKVGARTPADQRRRPRRSEKKPVSPAAERMRRYRERKKGGLRCIFIEVRDDEVRELQARGYLPAGRSDDPDAVVEALYEFLEDNLVPAGDL